jgi:hypothetical protein
MNEFDLATTTYRDSLHKTCAEEKHRLQQSVKERYFSLLFTHYTDSFLDFLADLTKEMWFS